MQKVAIGCGDLWLDLLDTFTVEPVNPDDPAANDGTIWAVLTAQPDLLCLTFSVLVRDDVDDADTAADLVAARRAKNLPVFQSADRRGPAKAWFEETDTAPDGDDYFTHSWIIGFGPRRILITLTGPAANLQHPDVFATIADLPRIIESIAERPAQSPLTASELFELHVDRQFILQILRQAYGPNEELPKNRAGLPLLQRLLDDRLFDSTDAAPWIALGTVWGDILAGELNLHWIMSCAGKESSPQPALSEVSPNSVLIPQSSLSAKASATEEVLIYPRAMLLARAQQNVCPDLPKLFTNLKKHLRRSA